MVADQPGQIPYLKIMRNLAWVCGLTVDRQTEFARELLQTISTKLVMISSQKLLNADQSTESGIMPNSVYGLKNLRNASQMKQI